MPIKVIIVPPNNTPEENQRLYEEAIEVLKQINADINSGKDRTRNKRLNEQHK